MHAIGSVKADVVACGIVVAGEKYSINMIITGSAPLAANADKLTEPVIIMLIEY